MFTFRIVENVLTDASCTYDLILTDETSAELRFHAITEGAAVALREALRAHIRELTVDLTECVA